jgi:hypothetical protein
MQRLAAVSLLFLALAIPAYAEDDIQVRIFNAYLEQANAGDSNSQFIVASRYESGKGTAKDLDKAYEWYEKAAAKGHPLAQRKVEERNGTKSAATPGDAIAEKLAAAAAAESRAAKPAPRPAPVPVRAAAPAVVKAEPVVVARAPEPVSLNTQQAVLGGKWNRQQKPAEYLPSSRAACLKTNDSEVTCFSEDVTRNVGDKGLTYTVKATLTGLDGRDGRFNLHYVYNVADVNGSPFGQPTSALSDVNDLTARSGWQEPGVKMECRLSDERSMTCTRADRKGTYQYSRD